MTKKERALMVAENVHHGQTYDIYPYIYHVRRVAEIAEQLGYDEEIVVACILHDVLEDTHLSYNDLRKAFGVEIAEIVYCVTDELGRNRKEKKAKTYPKIVSNWKSTVVKICDRIANMQQSIEYDEKKYEMYKKEHEDFSKLLKVSVHPVDVEKAWKRLESLL